MTVLGGYHGHTIMPMVSITFRRIPAGTADVDTVTARHLLALGAEQYRRDPNKTEYFVSGPPRDGY